MGGRGGSSGGGGGNSNSNNPENWSYPDLHDYVRDHLEGDEQDTINKVIQWLHMNSEPETKPVKDDNMSEEENLKTIHLNGDIDLLYNPDNEENAAITIIEITTGIPDLPERLQEQIKQIIMTNQSGAGAGATAGDEDGNIVIYDGRPATTGTLSHESGHNLAHQLWGTATPPDFEEGTDSYYERIEQGLPTSSDYANAINSGEPPVSDYGGTNAAEDFAEAIKLYVLNPARLKRIAPKRYKIIKQIMTNRGYKG